MKTMKSLILTLALVALAAGRVAAQFLGGETAGNVTLTIKADGSCVLRSSTTQTRKVLEQQVKFWERYLLSREGLDDSEEAGTPPTPPPKPDHQPLTDEALTTKIHQMMTNRSDVMPEEFGRIESLNVLSNEVRMVLVRDFPTLRELLDAGIHTWAPPMLMPERVRIEATNNTLRIAFQPDKNAARYASVLTRQLKSQKGQTDWRLLLPGKVLSSDFPITDGNATGIVVAGAKPEEVEKVAALVGKPIVVTAELGGLKLDEPLESGRPNRARRNPGTPELPITEAGPGFVAEAEGLTISTVYHFPAAGARTNAAPELALFGVEPDGVTIMAKLFPPKGRVIKSVSGARLLGAKDDQGRVIPAPKAADGAEEMDIESFSYSSDGEATPSTRVQVRTALPSPDAQTIEEVQAEVVAVTTGGYKDVTLTNVQADAQKPVDLGSLIPGAKLTVLKVTTKKTQSSVQVRLEGPPEVNHLELKIKRTSRLGSSYSQPGQSATKNNVTTRTLTVQSFDHEGGGGGPVTLEVRLPQDFKRERVKFKLAGLDLL